MDGTCTPTHGTPLDDCMDAGGRATQDAKAERANPLEPDAGCVSSWLLLLAAQQEEVTRRKGETRKPTRRECCGHPKHRKQLGNENHYQTALTMRHKKEADR